MKTGWFQTWPDKPNDGVYWLNGERLGRVYILHNGTWKWFTGYRRGERGQSGLVDTKEDAKAEVERRAQLPNSNS